MKILIYLLLAVPVYLVDIFETYDNLRPHLKNELNDWIQLNSNGTKFDKLTSVYGKIPFDTLNNYAHTKIKEFFNAQENFDFQKYWDKQSWYVHAQTFKDLNFEIESNYKVARIKINDVYRNFPYRIEDTVNIVKRRVERTIGKNVSMTVKLGHEPHEVNLDNLFSQYLDKNYIIEAIIEKNNQQNNLRRRKYRKI
jgi:hypothetical protein